uniref:Subtilisin inhibitor CLSI-II n=1 Tax=Canavalia lineata TaxID=28957 RepID=ICI2_CANLI|nr:RecName: Full=Subtilisin inhibitor CLSI-II; Contains: RecName: Full=Subtilisin inhibitor CLSI-III [Canavalia lineata]
NDVDVVMDASSKPIFPGGEYYIMPAIWGPPGGGVRLAKTRNSDCPVTVLQDYGEVIFGQPVKFTLPGRGSGLIITNTPVEEFIKKPECASSSKWSVFVDDEIEKACVGIGGHEDHPGEQVFSGTFTIQKSRTPYNSYKLVFCESDSSTCSDIGRYDNNEGGRRLILTHHNPFQVVFMDASTFDGTIRSDG